MLIGRVLIERVLIWRISIWRMYCIPPSNLPRLFNDRSKFWSKRCPLLGDVEDDPTALAPMLKIPARKFQTFTYTFGGGSDRIINTDAAEIAKALFPQRKSLRKLEISGCPERRVEDGKPFPKGFLKQFPVLQEVGIHIEFLVYKWSSLPRRRYEESSSPEIFSQRPL